jgi:hypothetical protein
LLDIPAHVKKKTHWERMESIIPSTGFRCGFGEDTYRRMGRVAFNWVLRKNDDNHFLDIRSAILHRLWETRKRRLIETAVKLSLREDRLIISCWAHEGKPFSLLRQFMSQNENRSRVYEK